MCPTFSPQELVCNSCLLSNLRHSDCSRQLRLSVCFVTSCRLGHHQHYSFENLTFQLVINSNQILCLEGPQLLSSWVWSFFPLPASTSSIDRYSVLSKMCSFRLNQCRSHCANPFESHLSHLWFGFEIFVRYPLLDYGELHFC